MAPRRRSHVHPRHDDLLSAPAMLLLAALLQIAAADTTDRFTFDIPRIDAEAQVDGRLDEEVWSRAARLDGFSQYFPVDGRPA